MDGLGTILSFLPLATLLGAICLLFCLWIRYRRQHPVSAEGSVWGPPTGLFLFMAAISLIIMLRILDAPPKDLLSSLGYFLSFWGIVCLIWGSIRSFRRRLAAERESSTGTY